MHDYSICTKALAADDVLMDWGVTSKNMYYLRKVHETRTCTINYKNNHIPKESPQHKESA